MGIMRKPEWFNKRIRDDQNVEEVVELLRELNLHSVCEEARCPNILECFSKRTATFMIMGSVCTRNCRFCAVAKGETDHLDPDEPRNIAKACRELKLKHVVVTSVTRDDLDDGGAYHFAKMVSEIRNASPETRIELLIPDMEGIWENLKVIVDSKPDILNHNLETIQRLYDKVRPMADYDRSLELLKRTKERNPDIYTKSGIMVGLGEKKEEVFKLMDDLRDVDCDIITIGQYLRPSDAHLEVDEYIKPEVFDEYGEVAYGKGFRYVASSPFTRSSYNADLVFQQGK